MKKLSYQTLVQEYMTRYGVGNINSIVDFINSHPSRQDVLRKADAKNVSVGISILGNPKRMKKPFRLIYERSLKLYFWKGHQNHEILRKVYEKKANA